MIQPGPWKAYRPEHYRSDEERELEAAEVEASVLADISVSGSVAGGGTAYGWYFAQDVFGWRGNCSPDMPKGLEYRIEQWQRWRARGVFA